MAETNGMELAAYYQHIQEDAKLRTQEHAERWSTAVLNTLGLYVDKGTRKTLAAALPDDLSADLRKKFWLAHFRDDEMTKADFLERVARRAGNTDIQFAPVPTTAVFRNIKTFIDDDVNQQVTDSLAPAISELWQGA